MIIKKNTVSIISQYIGFANKQNAYLYQLSVSNVQISFLFPENLFIVFSREILLSNLYQLSVLASAIIILVFYRLLFISNYRYGKIEKAYLSPTK